ncbi:hypothetical protein ACET3Z_020807 [Daucus carota]
MDGNISIQEEKMQAFPPRAALVAEVGQLGHTPLLKRPTISSGIVSQSTGKSREMLPLSMSLHSWGARGTGSRNEEYDKRIKVLALRVFSGATGPHSTSQETDNCETGGMQNHSTPFENEGPSDHIYANPCTVQWRRVTVYRVKLGDVAIKHVTPVMGKAAVSERPPHSLQFDYAPFLYCMT